MELDDTLFHCCSSHSQAPTITNITEEIRLRRDHQLSFIEDPRTPPLRPTDVEQSKVTPRSKGKRAIDIVAPVEQKNGLSALARPFKPRRKCLARPWNIELNGT